MATVQREDVVGVGLYSVPEAAKLLSFQIGAKQASRKLRRFGRGCKYFHEGTVRNAAPIVDSDLNLNGHHLFTFSELVELLVIGAFQREGVSLRVIRAAHDRAKKIFRHPHPFALKKFDTDGKAVFAEVKSSDVGEMGDEKLTLELHRVQVAFDKIVRPFFRNLDYVDDVAQRLWPLGQERSVVMDPARSFGKPINIDTGVPTAVLYAMHEGKSDVSTIADWYEVSVEGVRDAIAYEEQLRKAA